MSNYSKSNLKSKYQTTKIFSVVFLFFYFLVFLPGVTQAQILPSPSNDQCPPNYQGDNCGGYTLNDFVAILINYVNRVLAIVGGIALLFFVYGGIKLIISAGSSEKIEAGKAVFRAAVIGLIIVFVSWTIINFVTVSLGYNTAAFGVWFSTP